MTIDSRKTFTCTACGGGRITVHIKAWVRLIDGDPAALGAAHYPDTITPRAGDPAICGDCMHHWRLTGPLARPVPDCFRPHHPAWLELIEVLGDAIDYREAIRRGDLKAAATASDHIAALCDPDADDRGSSYESDEDEMGFFSSIWMEVTPNIGSIDDLVDDGDLKGAGEQLDRLITYLEETIDCGQPMRIIGWLEASDGDANGPGAVSAPPEPPPAA
jgi:hypothetical protein